MLVQQASTWDFGEESPCPISRSANLLGGSLRILVSSPGSDAAVFVRRSSQRHQAARLERALSTSTSDGLASSQHIPGWRLLRPSLCHGDCCRTCLVRLDVEASDKLPTRTAEWTLFMTPVSPEPSTTDNTYHLASKQPILPSSNRIFFCQKFLERI
jgi:hypothetical protein